MSDNVNYTDNTGNSEDCSPEACSGCAHAGGCPSKKDPSNFLEAQNKESNIKHVIGVVSGKGGVGKSLVTAALAAELKKKGLNVGIMDADITGPSIQKMFGLKGQLETDGTYMFPMLTKNGVKVVSVNLLLENEDDPVIWRGPVLAGVVKQFWTDVAWGELDFLLVDMPPGTGDVPLTVFQSLPLDGVIIVTSPQSLVGMIVKKAYNMARMMNIPVIGLVENYSYMECPHCGKKLDVFGKSSVDNEAGAIGAPVLGKLPIVPDIARLADEGKFDGADMPWLSDAVAAIEKL